MPTETSVTQAFIDRSAIDSSVNPGDNFYRFSIGKWEKNAIIPPTEIRIGTILDMFNRTKVNLHNIVDSLSNRKFEQSSLEQKVGDFYASAMDSSTVEKRGYDPINPYLREIASISEAHGIIQYVARQQVANNSLLFFLYIGADVKNSTYNIPVFSQGGLGLPDREYYFKTDAATLSVVKAYQAYVQKTFELTGDPPATAAAKTVMVFNLERQLAQSHRTNVDLRDPQSNYHKLAVAELDRQMPEFSWRSTLSSMNIHTDCVNVAQPAFYIKLNTLLKAVPLPSWKAYLQFHTVDQYADALSKAFVTARFDYEGKSLNGQMENKPRWERMLSLTDRVLGDALGRLYVKKYFTETARKRMLELISNLQKAFENRINRLDWMSDSTKAKAKEKLYALQKKVGYPDKWRDYSNVVVKRHTYFENLMACNQNEYQFQIAKIGKPVDKTEWQMSAPSINAYYNPLFNEIVFPAGILQPPFFDVNADDAINYGGIGLIISHEMTHAFDDQGAQFDNEGNLKNWWSRKDSIAFREKAKKVIELYNGFVVLDSLHINGALTNGENIADIGGLNIAYDAFKLTKQGFDTAKIEGFTPDQRFFLSLGQISREKCKDEFIRRRIETDPHSPFMYRVNGTLMNCDGFYRAFNVKKGDKMYLPDSARIRIW